MARGNRPEDLGTVIKELMKRVRILESRRSSGITADPDPEELLHGYEGGYEGGY